MAGIAELETQKAQAIDEAIRTLEELLGGEGSPRLYSARFDVQARSMAGFDVAMVVADLTRVVAQQHKELAETRRSLKKLGKALEALEEKDSRQQS
jgi:hypothetical protein